MSLDPRTLAPIVSFGATWLVRRAIVRMYEGRTGNDAPSVNDLDMPLSKVLLWSATTAIATTVVDVLIARGAAYLAERQEAGEAIAIRHESV